MRAGSRRFVGGRSEKVTIHGPIETGCYESARGVKPRLRVLTVPARKPQSESEAGMDVEKIRELIELMNDNDLLEVEIEEEDRKVRLRKKAPPEERSSPLVMAAPPALPVPTAPSAPPAAAPPPAAPEPDTNRLTVNAPMVGTFYRASSPEAEPLVDVGDELGPDTVTCIIEAMKVMNEIKAEVSGRVSEVLVQNGEPVEYGQPLFVVQPD